MYKYLFVLLAFPLLSRAQQKAKCTDSRNPVVLVHGFLASGDTWSSQVNRLLKNGYCRERIFVFDWNTVGFDRKRSDSLLNVMIDSARLVCHASAVDLAGHSAGGGLCYAYLSDSVNSLKVAHYIHIGSGPVKGPAGFKGQVPTLIISSEGDKVTGIQQAVPGAQNIRQKGNDHVQVQTSAETFRDCYAFLNDGRMPANETTVKRVPNTVKLSGRVVYFGDNEPLATDSILVFTFDPLTGKRNTDLPMRILRSDAKGFWPVVEVPASQHIEFEVHPPGGRVISYYLEPQKEDNSCVYLRCLPQKGLVAGLFRKMPRDSAQSVLAIFSARQAVIHGRDSLVVDGTDLSSEELAPASRTVLASFIFDDGDGQSSGKLIKSFGTGVFLNGVDKLIRSGNDQRIEIYFNGRTMSLPCRPSAEALMVAIFN